MDLLDWNSTDHFSLLFGVRFGELWIDLFSPLICVYLCPEVMIVYSSVKGLLKKYYLQTTQDELLF
jgi:hypothetical protein